MDTASDNSPPPPTQTNAQPLPGTASSGGGDIPDFVRLQQIPVNYVQQVETDLLESVVFQQGTTTTDGFCRFTLQNKGFLHSHSKIFLALEPQDNASSSDCYFAPHIGVGQVVKKAVLKIGNKTLNELESWDGLHAVKSSLISNENNFEREMYMTGRAMSNKFVYNADDNQLAENVGLDTGMEVDEDKLSLPGALRMNGSKKSEVPSFMIDLSDLFPFLKIHQLPLYMINEAINIELTFHPTIKQRCQIAGVSGIATEKEFHIVRDQLKFCADYIFYGATDEMERYANANKDLNFSFVDYRVIEATTSHTDLGSGIVRNLGMANRLVPRVITTLPCTDQNEESILGSVNSIAPFLNASGIQADTLKYNIRYNDRYEYTSDIDNTARLFSAFTDSEGVPFLNRTMYAAQGNMLEDNEDFQGRNQDTNLEGQLFYVGSRLTNGRVGQRGIELHLSGDWASSGRPPTLLRCYCEYLRVARLVDGMIEIYNA
jgi:hypothetical protein